MQKITSNRDDAAPDKTLDAGAGAAPLSAPQPMATPALAPANDRMPEWLAAALYDYHRMQRPLIKLQRWRALASATLLASVANLAFLMVKSPDHQIFWLLASGAALGLSLLQLPIAYFAATRIERRRIALVRQFFDLGLRLDEAGRLVQNRARGRIIVGLDTITPVAARTGL